MVRGRGGVPPRAARAGRVLVEDVEGDREAVEALSGRPYADVEADLAVWSALDDAPLLRLGSAWRVVSKEDAWDLIFRLVTPTDLARFHELAPRVLQEPDPALDVPPARRFMASIVGEPRRYSARLQQGLADTAAFLGGYATDQVLRDGLTGKLHARRLVTAVTGNASADGTGRAWQSLADVLPLLERMETLLRDPEILGKNVRAHASPNNFEGVGILEAPRGTLIHHYRIDQNGLIESANLVIATGHNNLAINRGVLQVARRFVRGNTLEQGMLNRVEAVVRAFDPCLSCSTHAAGQMPLLIELMGADGTVLDRLRR